MISPPARILFLQRTIGNKAVQRFIKSGALKAKLRIGQPGDIYEKEADWVADAVMRKPEPKVSKQVSISDQSPSIYIQSKCEKELRRLPSEEEEEKQATAVSEIAEINPEQEAQIKSLQSGGQPLPANVRDFFEPRFGCDFSNVRIHADAQAANSSKALNALAYTVGSDIVFGGAQYAPATQEGKRLIAHELAHVVQQSNLPPSRAAMSVSPTTSYGLPTIKEKAASIIQRSVGSPAGGCGVCYGNAADAGTMAHIIIEKAFEDTYGHAVLTEFPLLLFPNPGDENGKLDLATPIEDGFAIGEIKPANPAGLLQGDLDLFWYEDQITKYQLRVERMKLPQPPHPLVFPNPGLPGCPLQELFIVPQVHGIYTYYCEPDFKNLIGRPGCECDGKRVPVPVPVPVPEKEREEEKKRITIPELSPGLEPVPARREIFEDIADFIRRVVRSGEDAEKAARRFLEEHPEVKYVLIGAAIAIIVATIIEDIATLGAGILDDPASIAAAYALVRVAQAAP